MTCLESGTATDIDGGITTVPPINFKIYFKNNLNAVNIFINIYIKHIALM